MTDTIPGENKRSNTPSPNDTDHFGAFNKVISVLDTQIQSANHNDAHDLEQTKNLMISYQKESQRIYDIVFKTNPTEPTGKKTRSSKRISTKHVSNDNGHAHTSS